MAESHVPYSESLTISPRPLPLLVISVVCLAAAILLSNRFFPDLGPSPDMFVSDNPAKRWTAKVTVMEIIAVRSLFAAVGLSLAAIWVFWGPWVRSPLVQRVARHRPSMPAAGPLFNRSLAIMLAAATGMLIWVAFGSRYPDLVMPAWIAREDGVVEWSTAFLFLSCAPLSARMALLTGERRRQLLHWGLAALFVLCFLEEISWGQRLFAVETPETLAKLNAQNEINLHNSFGYAADHAFIVTVFAYGALLPVMTRISPLVHRLVDMVALPIASLGLAAGFAVVSTLHDFTVFAVLDTAPVRIAEVREFLTSLGFLLLMLETLRRQRDHGVPRAERTSTAR